MLLHIAHRIVFFKFQSRNIPRSACPIYWPCWPMDDLNIHLFAMIKHYNLQIGVDESFYLNARQTSNRVVLCMLPLFLKMALVSFIDWLDIRSILLLLLVFLAVYCMQRPRNLPPGPWRFPIVGWLPQLMWYMYKGEEMHLLATRFVKKYGKIYSK